MEAQKYEHVTNEKNVDNMNQWQFIGNLTGHRCPSCGACLWVNQVGNIWCSNCRYLSNSNEIQDYPFLPVPNDHKWNVRGVTIFNYPLFSEFKTLRVT